MDSISKDFYDFDMQQAMRLAQSDTARQLFSLLQAGNNPQLQSAMAKAATGDMTDAKKILAQLMENEQTRPLLQQLMGDANG